MSKGPIEPNLANFLKMIWENHESARAKRPNARPYRTWEDSWIGLEGNGNTLHATDRRTGEFVFEVDRPVLVFMFDDKGVFAWSCTPNGRGCEVNVTKNLSSSTLANLDSNVLQSMNEHDRRTGFERFRERDGRRS